MITRRRRAAQIVTDRGQEPAMRRFVPLFAVGALALGIASAPRHIVSRPATDFVHFESGHVRPAALTPGGDRLLVVNTPNSRLAIFDVTGAHPVKVGDVPVGLEPVSVAALSDAEAWVVNHLSDDVSVVDLTTLNVRATLRVGDEPADVVFANGQAYVSVSQYDQVRVYDPRTLQRVTSIPIGARMPRALARSADGARVFVAGLHAGNRTSVLSEAEAGDSLPPPSPPMSPGLPPAPGVGLIIQQHADGDWVDETGRTWSAKARHWVLDVDVTEISTSTNAVTRFFGGIGSLNFALAVNGAGTIAATATEARNLVRFEPKLRGHAVDTRAAFIRDGEVTLSDLNPHIDYSVTPGLPGESDSSLGTPTGAAWSGDDQRLYVTSLASDRLAVLDPARPNQVMARVPTVDGPTGVVVDDARGRLYVVGRFRNQLQTLSTADFSQVAVASIGFDPTPDEIVNGRRFFYGGFTSGHGDQSCATCHPFGDFDALGWDLGDPTGTMQPIDGSTIAAHPMKGPMTTQTLRGLTNVGLLHWRADRKDLDAFNGAFVSLLGRAGMLSGPEMAAFDAFVLPLVHPPNPYQNLDRTMPGDSASTDPSAARGQKLFMTPNGLVPDFAATCAGCHFNDDFRPGTSGQVIPPLFLGGAQDMKVPHLRNLYRKTGFIDRPSAVSKRGFGFMHNGAMDNLLNFLRQPTFDFGPEGLAEARRRDVEQFLLAFDTGIAPAVGHQITFDAANRIDLRTLARLDTLTGQADLGYCDLVAKGRIGHQPGGWLYLGEGMWRPDRLAEIDLPTQSLLGLAMPGSEITVSGVPPGSGMRMGIDQDRDGYRDRDELNSGTDPADPLSTPDVIIDPPAPSQFALRSVSPNPFQSEVEVAFTLGRAGLVDLVVYDVLGRVLRSVAREAKLEAGPQTLRWDGLDDGGRQAAPGVYFVRVRTERATWTRPVVRVR